MTRWFLAALGVGAVMGCSSSGTQDSGNPDSGSTQDGGSGSGAVQGTHFIHYLTDTGEVLRPLDLSGGPPSASVWTDAGFVTFSAQLVDAGFVIPGVPSGEYYLNMGAALTRFPWSSFWVVTPSRAVDLGEYFSGRPDVEFSDGGQSTQFALTGLIPWDPVNDSLAVASLGGDFSSSFQLTADAGATVDNELQSYLGYDWLLFNNGGLITAASGDQTFVTQQRQSNDGGVVAFSTIAGVAVSGFSQPGASAGALLASLVSSPTTTVSLTVHSSQFSALDALVSPAATDQGVTFVVGALLGGSPSSYATLQLLNESAASGGDLLLGGSYVNPAPSTWPVTASISNAALVLYSLPNPDGGVPFKKGYGPTTTSTTDWLAALVAAPASPRISPATGLAVGGQPAVSTVNNAGLTPVVSWSAPSVGAANYYQVGVRALNFSGKGYVTADVALLWTAHTSLQLPPGLLQPGVAHVINVVAVQAPNDDVFNKPLQLTSVPNAFASTWSGLVYP